MLTEDFEVPLHRALTEPIFLAGRGRARRVEELVRVTGFDAQGYHLEPAFPHLTARRQGNRS